MSRDGLQLRMLRAEDEVAFRAAVMAFTSAEPKVQFAFHFDPLGWFPDYVQMLQAWSRGEQLSSSWVPTTYLVGVVDDQVVGRISLRHKLNDFLYQFGGHIGYAVVPHQRRRGYATEMLRQTLPIAVGLGLERVLLTCDEDNLASRRIIEQADGVFDGTAQSDEPGAVPKRRYWISLEGISPGEIPK